MPMRNERAIREHNQRKREEDARKRLQRFVEWVADWNLDVRPGHADYRSRTDVANAAAATLEELRFIEGKD